MTRRRAHLVPTALLGICHRCAARSPRPAAVSPSRRVRVSVRDCPPLIVCAGVRDAPSASPASRTAPAWLGDTPICPCALFAVSRAAPPTRGQAGGRHLVEPVALADRPVELHLERPDAAADLLVGARHARGVGAALVRRLPVPLSYSLPLRPTGFSGFVVVVRSGFGIEGRPPAFTSRDAAALPATARPVMASIRL